MSKTDNNEPKPLKKRIRIKKGGGHNRKREPMHGEGQYINVGGRIIKTTLPTLPSLMMPLPKIEGH